MHALLETEKEKGLKDEPAMRTRKKADVTHSSRRTYFPPCFSIRFLVVYPNNQTKGKKENTLFCAV